ncbi:hypothetical protein [Micromonospora sp. NPDC047730]|uniref:hypothetical protein n=1 Tax=Micromonospora sp. NPDC047730 TaxID=3364253 RepID=UPI00371618FF
MTALAALAVSIALTGWLFMVTVGVIRGEWLHDLPTIGFGSSMLVATLIGACAAVMRGTHGARSDS